MIHRTAGEGEGGGGISLNTVYHFFPFPTRFAISRAITAETSPLHLCTVSWPPLNIKLDKQHIRKLNHTNMI